MVKDRNDILAALPEHPILKTAIESAIVAYNKCDELEFGDSVNNKTVMDMKRYRDPNYLNSLDDPRLNLTITLSGPDLFNSALEEYKEQEPLIEKFDTLTAENRCSKVSFANLSIDIAGKSDLTWLKPDKILAKAFDDSALLNRCNFFLQFKKSDSPYLYDDKSYNVLIRK